MLSRKQVAFITIFVWFTTAIAVYCQGNAVSPAWPGSVFFLVLQMHIYRVLFWLSWQKCLLLWFGLYKERDSDNLLSF